MDKAILFSPQQKGLFYGLLGVLGFSLTPPATRMAVAHLDPNFVGLGRALLAAVFATLLLYVMKAPRPARHHRKSLLIVAACVVFLFPLLSSWSLHYLTASHTGVVLGILPLATAIAGALRTGERPAPLFWFVGLCGAVTVITFSILNGGGHFQPGDIVICAAVIAAAIGYTEGAQLAKVLGGWQVICWALVMAMPFLLIPTIIVAWPMNFDVPLSAWIGFIYVTLSSQLISFFFWYHGLALGGISRVSQLMLLMPFMTLLASQVLLNDTVTQQTWLFAAVIILIVFMSKQLSINITLDIKEE